MDNEDIECRLREEGIAREIQEEQHDWEGLLDDNRRLRQALRAAEAECAEWRGQFRRTGWGDEDPTVWHWDGPSHGTLINEPADANDETRKRLGLEPIK